jgi:hypothetical protein
MDAVSDLGVGIKIGVRAGRKSLRKCKSRGFQEKKNVLECLCLHANTYAKQDTCQSKIFLFTIRHHPQPPWPLAWVSPPLEHS